MVSGASGATVEGPAATGDPDRTASLRRMWHALRPRLRGRWLMLLLLVVAIEATYVFVVSAGHVTDWPQYTKYLDDQAEGFRSGHLHLIVEPPPALVAAPNPKDPVNKDLWYWDASYHKGHLYLYWGPVPSLLLATFKTAVRMKTQVGDQYVVFVLASLQLLAGTLLISRAQQRLFPGVPPILVAIAIVAFGLVNPTLYILARACVYESAIVGGHAFVVTGLLFAFEAVWRARTGAAGSNLRLALAGACWALALGCRVSIAPGVAVLVLATALGAVPRGARWWLRALRAALCVGGPVVLGVVALLAYNRARFDSWLDFGWHYQLTWIESKVSSDFVRPNLYSYLRRPFISRCTFPFLYAVEAMAPDLAFPKGYSLPEEYVIWEHLTGVVTAVPWAWLTPVAIGTVIVTAWRGVRRRGRAQDTRAILVAWLIASATVAATLTMIVVLRLNGATMRYLGDGAGALAIVGSLAAFVSYWELRDRVAARRAVVIVCALLMLMTASVGIALGFEGQHKHFRLHNPALLDKLETRFSTCAR